MVDAFKPDYVAPLVGFLASTDCETTGELFEVSGGWAAKVRWERSGGVSPPFSLGLASAPRLTLLDPAPEKKKARLPER